MTTGEVARACGVSADTIRYYERQGAIDSVRSANGYRSYAESTVRRVTVIRRALGIGFSLDQIVVFFRERSAGDPPCRKVRAAAEAKLGDLDREIAEMIALRKQMAEILRNWDERLSVGEPAYLLESLPSECGGLPPPFKAVPRHRTPKAKESL
jgi:MerR family transcriptional regulator, Zn(II)-responsive regulator of zntA